MAQANPNTTNETLIKNINSSMGDTEVIDPNLKKLQQKNDLVISFATLNYAWARKGTFYVIASHKGVWQLFTYESKLPPSAEDETSTLTPQTLSANEAEKIRNLYAQAALWKTEGDNGESFCSTKKDCNINDAETWTLSIATPQHIHTTTFYAADFFEDCCPGNPYRKAFVAIGKEIMKLSPKGNSLPDK